ncbi:cell division protein SepF [Ammoniphilus sp. YIM 78166]|uniref:cell division protein SepF n=1 Tax=Ammoniphilus sp. YIM 78166 TaxID=1644106 RepID=UPI00106FC94B|nr:cell division protein SepF [Ammoniphilus sp. YIM 78166]
MGVMNKIMGYLGLSGEETYDDYSDRAQSKQEVEYEEPANKKARNNVVSLQHAKEQVKMVLVEPRAYDEVQEIADHLRSRRPVIINLQRVSGEQGKRIIDFLSGTVYALNGDIQKVGQNIFMCAPDNVDIQGTISELLMNDDTYPR